MQNQIVFFLLGTAVSTYGVLAILDPERAFKLHNLFQIHEVELTQYGNDSAVVGGFLSIVIG